MRIFEIFERIPIWLRYGLIFSFTVHIIFFSSWGYFGGRGLKDRTIEIKSVNAEFLGMVDYTTDNITDENTTLGDGDGGIAREFENQGEQTVEEIVNEERAPTENVTDNSVSSTNAAVAPPVQNATEQAEEPEETYQRPIEITDIKTPHRPGHLKTLANREEEGTDVAGGAEISSTLEAQMMRGLGQCFNVPPGDMNVYSAPITITVSASGEIISSEFAEGYNPVGPERAFANAARRAGLMNACKQLPVPQGGKYTEGQKITLKFGKK